MVISRRASTEGTQSTVFFSLISSAALFFFFWDYSYVNYARTYIYFMRAELLLY